MSNGDRPELTGSPTPMLGRCACQRTMKCGNTEGVYQVTLTVYNMLVDQVIEGHALSDVLNDEINGR